MFVILHWIKELTYKLLALRCVLWKFPPVCLLRPVCLFFLRKIPTCTFIPTCTTIPHLRVLLTCSFKNSIPPLGNKVLIKCYFCFYLNHRLYFSGEYLLLCNISKKWFWNFLMEGSKLWPNLHLINQLNSLEDTTN